MPSFEVCYEHGDDATNIIDEIIDFVDDLINIYGHLITGTSHFIKRIDQIINSGNLISGSHHCTPLVVLFRLSACGLQVSDHEYVARWVP